MNAIQEISTAKWLGLWLPAPGFFPDSLSTRRVVRVLRDVLLTQALIRRLTLEEQLVLSELTRLPGAVESWRN